MSEGRRSGLPDEDPSAASPELIVEMRVGSHLYGTDTPRSDLDIKGVYLPAARDILLQRVAPSLLQAAAKAPGQRNQAGDQDCEYYSLQRYLEFLAEGQTGALDMLFAPEGAMLRPPAPLWYEIQAASGRLVTRQAASFLRYSRQQAAKFGIKGSRVAAGRRALAVLSAAEARLGTTARLEEIADELAILVQGAEHLGLVDLPAPGGEAVPHLEVCGRKISYRVSIKTAREIVQKLVEEYGARALQAERNEGVDWKALSHAVRVGREAVELLQTGRIAFPLREAGHLKRIKAGEIPYQLVAEEIESLLVEVETAAAGSRLSPTPDRGLIEELVSRAYRQQIERGP
ncbi:hypothetical protein FRZ44_06410 [Hypericibacter terrae]|uniref:Nucleotidyltransferase n=1 Tax=Hypericibacter terrae TaxID=2602015 RepID=A0A5J6MD40_9PROT|nr:nucleotidyltransferase domain-containing protein [Hypericibacter terrae]QEX15358.1 hypothetical protein FRZ44_06410 [Hypericibacter terrae]